jgi:hypothetical protein
MATDEGFNRRRFITSGMALGGSLPWVPSLAAGRDRGLVPRIKALRAEVAAGSVRDDRVQRSMLSKLDRAVEAAQDGDEDLASSLLRKFVQVADQAMPGKDSAVEGPVDRDWGEEARAIRDLIRRDSEVPDPVGAGNGAGAIEIRERE